jgi:hypothetical protein
MRRLFAVGAVALLLVLAAAVQFTSASTTPVIKHVDGSVMVAESPSRTWLARFEVRTTSGVVQFGYLELYGTGADQLGEIHQFTVDSVDYYKTPSGAQGATLHMQECIMIPATPCFPSEYTVSDGGSNDTFLESLGWTVQSGNISIYSTGGQNGQ